MRSSDREITPERKESKARSKASITPRTFRRFFTPRSSLNQSGRETLGEITFSGSNVRKRRIAARPSGLYDVDENVAPETPESLPKRHLWQTLNEDADGLDSKRQRTSHCEGVEVSPTLAISHQAAIPSPPIRRSGLRRGLGDCLRRELDAGAECHLETGRPKSIDARFETARIYSRPEDVHVCKDPISSNRTLPFCATACNSKAARLNKQVRLSRNILIDYSQLAGCYRR